MKTQSILPPLTLRFAIFVASTAPVVAHPGHDHPVTPPEHPMHWFVEPQHVIGWAGMALVVIAVSKVWKNVTSAQKSKITSQSNH